MTKETSKTKYGLFAGSVGIVINVLLSAFKITFGFLTGLTSMATDGMNNLLDSSSAFVTVLSFYVSKKPADEKHPYGYKRSEYIGGLIISVLIMITGALLFKSAVEKVIAKTTPELNYFLFVTIGLGVSIFLKIIQSVLYYLFYKKTKSDTLKLTAIDSFFDILITTGVLVSLIVFKRTSVNVDSYLALLISLIILFNGAKLLKATISPLLGERPKQALVNEIMEYLKSFKDRDNAFFGFHDLSIHSYGTGKTFVIVHLEFDSKIPAMAAHDLIDEIEMGFKKRFNYDLTIHYDPIDLTNDFYFELKDYIMDKLKTINENFNLHELRIFPKRKHIRFEVEVPKEVTLKEKELSLKVLDLIREKTNGYTVEIIFDYHYLK